jgi:hypothetical protein
MMAHNAGLGGRVNSPTIHLVFHSIREGSERISCAEKALDCE